MASQGVKMTQGAALKGLSTHHARFHPRFCPSRAPSPQAFAPFSLHNYRALPIGSPPPPPSLAFAGLETPGLRPPQVRSHRPQVCWNWFQGTWPHTVLGHFWGIHSQVMPPTLFLDGFLTLGAKTPWPYPTCLLQEAWPPMLFLLCLAQLGFWNPLLFCHRPSTMIG
jgi:hypothetical protein